MLNTGIVKFFDAEKGYGFITPDEGGSDVFVHRTALNDAGLTELPNDTKISYQLESDRVNGKIKAVDLTLI